MQVGKTIHDSCASHRSPSTVKMLKVMSRSNSQGEVVTVKEDPPRGVGIAVTLARIISHTMLSVGSVQEGFDKMRYTKRSMMKTNFAAASCIITK